MSRKRRRGKESGARVLTAHNLASTRRFLKSIMPCSCELVVRSKRGRGRPCNNNLLISHWQLLLCFYHIFADSAGFSAEPSGQPLLHVKGRGVEYRCVIFNLLWFPKVLRLELLFLFLHLFPLNSFGFPLLHVCEFVDTMSSHIQKCLSRTFEDHKPSPRLVLDRSCQQSWSQKLLVAGTILICSAYFHLSFLFLG